MKIEYIKIDQLHEDENNAKIHTQEQVDHIKNSIEKFGFSDPIAVWGDNNIIEGNGRLQAAIQMGLKEVPIIRIDHMSEKERTEYGIIHNQLTINTGFDDRLLMEELQSIAEIDMSELGFSDMDAQTFFDENKEKVQKNATVYIYPGDRRSELEKLLSENGYKYSMK